MIFFCSLRRLVAEFQHGGRHNLSHLVLDPARSRLYVAGTNVLYQLDDALRVSHKVETGEMIYFRTSLHLKPSAAAEIKLKEEQMQCSLLPARLLCL